MKTVSTFHAARELQRGIVGLVPTMGYLHEGHLELIRTAARRCDTVVASVFVNPLQFGDASDLELYPRDLSRDADLAESVGADVVFAPTVDEMYAAAHPVTVSVGGVADAMEGIHRPGHFDGVATVVAKLFAGIRPEFAFFGRKDAQQLALVTAMAEGLSMPVTVVGCPTVREADGLALSSRNTRLSTGARADAVCISAALFDVADRFRSGERDAVALKGAVHATLDGVPGIDLEYAEVADARSASVIDEVVGESFLAVAATVGGVRLIDNVFLNGRDGTADVGSRLEKRSILYGGEPCC